MHYWLFVGGIHWFPVDSPCCDISSFSWSPPGQNGHHLTDDILDAFLMTRIESGISMAHKLHWLIILCFMMFHEIISSRRNAHNYFGNYINGTVNWKVDKRPFICGSSIEWVSGWMSERVGEWVSEWVCDLPKPFKWVGEWVSEWMNERMNEWMTYHICWDLQSPTEISPSQYLMWIQPIMSCWNQLLTIKISAIPHHYTANMMARGDWFTLKVRWYFFSFCKMSFGHQRVIRKPDAASPLE